MYSKQLEGGISKNKNYNSNIITNNRNKMMNKNGIYLTNIYLKKPNVNKAWINRKLN